MQNEQDLRQKAIDFLQYRLKEPPLKKSAYNIYPTHVQDDGFPKTKDKILKGYSAAKVYQVPIKDINTDEALFQNRSEKYSEDSFNKIVSAVKDGTFILDTMDPILLWKNKDTGRLYVLSGHSRKAAFAFMAKNNFKYQNIDFNFIPAKILDGSTVSLESAIQIAKTSNTLSTPETDIQRTIYYKQLLLNGNDLSTVEQQIKRLEGKNALRILAFTQLNPSRKSFQTLLAFKNLDIANEQRLKNIIYWIGMARYKFQQLTAQHEDEMYNYLFDKSFAKKEAKENSINDFLSKIRSIISKNTNKEGVFNQSKPLNLNNVQNKGFSENEYLKLLNEAKNSLDKQEKIRSEKSITFITKQAEDIKKAKLEGKPVPNIAVLDEQYNNAIKAYRDMVDGAVRKLRDVLTLKPSFDFLENKNTLFI